YSRQRSAARTAWPPSCGLCASPLPGGDHTAEESVEHQRGSPSWAWFLQVIRGLVLKNTNCIPLARISVLPSGRHRWYIPPPPLERSQAAGAGFLRRYVIAPDVGALEPLFPGSFLAAVTDFTEMVSPFAVPVTLACSQASLLSSSSAALSEVSRV